MKPKPPNYRTITPEEIAAGAIPCWKCSHSWSAFGGTRSRRCHLHDDARVAALATCEKAEAKN